jgi:hypothetical protein
LASPFKSKIRLEAENAALPTSAGGLAAQADLAEPNNSRHRVSRDPLGQLDGLGETMSVIDKVLREAER